MDELAEELQSKAEYSIITDLYTEYIFTLYSVYVSHDRRRFIVKDLAIDRYYAQIGNVTLPAIIQEIENMGYKYKK